MDVRVDAAGRDIGALCIDDFRLTTRRRQVGSNAEDLAILDSDALASREDLGSGDLLTVA
jgi:hypothetical protein